MKKLYTLVVFAMVAAVASAASLSLLDVAVVASGIESGHVLSKQVLPAGNVRKAAASPQKVAVTPPESSGTWTQWTDAGPGVATFANLMDMTGLLDAYDDAAMENLPVSVRSDVANPNIQQFRVSNIMSAGYDIIIDLDASTGQVWIQPQESGYMLADENLKFVDFGTAYTLIDPANLGMTKEELMEVVETYAQYNYYIEPLNRIYVFCAFFSESAGDACAMVDMTIQLPVEVDYAPVVEAPKYFDGTGAATAKITVDQGVTDVRYKIYDGWVCQWMINEILKDADGVKRANGSAEISLAGLSEQNVVKTLLVVTYADGVPMEYSSCSFTPVSDENDSWRSLGKTSVTMPILETLFTNPYTPTVYNVEIQQNVNDENIYRLVNPFGAEYPLNAAGDFDLTYNHYMIIDATDHEAVLLKPMDMGIDWGAGSFYIQNGTYYWLKDGSKTLDALKESGFGGNYTDESVIEFPAKTIYVKCDDWTAFGGQAGAVYTSGQESFRIEIPSNGVADIAVDSESGDVRYYNLQGIAIDEPVAGQIVIARRGGKATKVIVR